MPESLSPLRRTLDEAIIAECLAAAMLDSGLPWLDDPERPLDRFDVAELRERTVADRREAVAQRARAQAMRDESRAMVRSAHSLRH